VEETSGQNDDADLHERDKHLDGRKRKNLIHGDLLSCGAAAAVFSPWVNGSRSPVTGGSTVV
jgi:hypothetical protein